MGDEWRRKTYYRPRVLIDTSRILDPQFPDSLLCITGAQIEMLRNLTQYLHRRSTFASEYQDQYYLAPTNEEWDSLEAIVADLEDTLMGCDEITTALNSIAAQVACLCLRSNRQPSYTPATQGILDHFVDEGQARHDNPYPQTTVGDADRCAISQLVWQGAWEMLTELIQPAQDAASDVMLPMVMVLVASWVGPAVFNIPTGVALAVLWNAIEVVEAGSLTNVANTFWSIREELVCALYAGLNVDANTASQMAREVINEQSLAPLDKVCLGLLCSPWMCAAAKLAWNSSTAWALANVTAGYCDACPDELIGNDWWARRLQPTGNTVILNHPVGQAWYYDCWEGSVPAGQVCCGIVYTVQNVTGNCAVTPMGKSESSCIGDELWPNTSHELAEVLHLALNDEEVDKADIIATLCPGAIEKPTDAEVNQVTGATDISAGFKIGWDCTGYAEVYVSWQIFEGTTPPA